MFHGEAVVAQYPINPGDSGGGVMNDNFELVGLNMAYTKEAQLVSYIVHKDELQSVLNSVNP